MDRSYGRSACSTTSLRPWASPSRLPVRTSLGRTTIRARSTRPLPALTYTPYLRTAWQRSCIDVCMSASTTSGAWDVSPSMRPRTWPLRLVSPVKTIVMYADLGSWPLQYSSILSMMRAHVRAKQLVDWKTGELFTVSRKYVAQFVRSRDALKAFMQIVSYRSSIPPLRSRKATVQVVS